ncbi:MAG: hypothetical protein IIB82_12720 [Bacteroidetes bacterium]|nr:hypothetical protein [Bacteroidota bacterium]
MAAFIFMLLMAWLAYDISKKTTFPGSKSKNEVVKDTVNADIDSRIKLQETDTQSIQ